MYTHFWVAKIPYDYNCPYVRLKRFRGNEIFSSPIHDQCLKFLRVECLANKHLFSNYFVHLTVDTVFMDVFVHIYGDVKSTNASRKGVRSFSFIVLYVFKRRLTNNLVFSCNCLAGTETRLNLGK